MYKICLIVCLLVGVVGCSAQSQSVDGKSDGANHTFAGGENAGKVADKSSAPAVHGSAVTKTPENLSDKPAPTGNGPIELDVHGSSVTVVRPHTFINVYDFSESVQAKILELTEIKPLRQHVSYYDFMYARRTGKTGIWALYSLPGKVLMGPNVFTLHCRSARSSFLKRTMERARNEAGDLHVSNAPQQGVDIFKQIYDAPNMSVTSFIRPQITHTAGNQAAGSNVMASMMSLYLDQQVVYGAAFYSGGDPVELQRMHNSFVAWGKKLLAANGVEASAGE